jgi:hypothetical protein
VLAQLWNTVPAAGPDLEQLMRTSMRLRDGRLYSHLLRVAAEPHVQPEIRVAAMLVLAKYVNPGNGVYLAQLVPPDTIRYVRMATGSTNHRSSFDGSVPLPAGYGRNVLTVLERLAGDRAHQPRAVWYAAEMLRQRVEFDLGLRR